MALVLLVYSYDCNGTNAQKWLIDRGNTKVQVAGTNFCLDAGSSTSFHSLRCLFVNEMHDQIPQAASG